MKRIILGIFLICFLLLPQEADCQTLLKESTTTNLDTGQYKSPNFRQQSLRQNIDEPLQELDKSVLTINMNVADPFVMKILYDYRLWQNKPENISLVIQGGIGLYTYIFGVGGVFYTAKSGVIIDFDFFQIESLLGINYYSNPKETNPLSYHVGLRKQWTSQPFAVRIGIESISTNSLMNLNLVVGGGISF